MVNLDEPALFTALDPSGMRHRLAEVASQAEQGWQRGLQSALPARYGQVARVVLAGMGGSAMGGDLIAGLLAREGVRVPLCVWRDFGLPAWADASTLVVACSYSGYTEETISTAHAAHRRGCPVVVISRGGSLGRWALRQGIPWLRVDYEGEPRTALGYTMMACLGLLCNLGLVRDCAGEVEEAVALLADLAGRYQTGSPTPGNQAKALASQLWGKQAVVYGAGPMAPVARRWKTQINENAKAWAFAEALPELHHNSVAGYLRPSPIRHNTLVVLLRCRHLSAQDLQRYETTLELLEAQGVSYRVVDAPGEGLLAQVMGATYLGDWTSYYLALLYGEDPSPVPCIDTWKARLRGR